MGVLLRWMGVVSPRYFLELPEKINDVEGQEMTNKPTFLYTINLVHQSHKSIKGYAC